MEMPVVLIPALEPDGRLPAYVRELKNSGFQQIVVIDDGSGPDWQPVFSEVEQEGATVLHHLVNKGKGAALKLGYDWIGAHCKDCVGVLTADSDGQHTVKDCLNLAKCLASGEKALYLGSRDFSQKNVPPKSRQGNRITSAVFKLLYGQYLPDTQTGLRAFRREELAFMTGWQAAATSMR